MEFCTDHWGPQHVAAALPNPATLAALKLLLEGSPGLARVRDSSRWLPIHLAAERGSAEAVQLLLAAAPELAADTGANCCHIRANTPLHLVAAHGAVEATKLLAAAAPEAITLRSIVWSGKRGCAALDYALEEYHDANHVSAAVPWR
ncbi:hypothetical protein ABPG75_007069 [Micractinium tetrahymenae]